MTNKYKKARYKGAEKKEAITAPLARLALVAGDDGRLDADGRRNDLFEQVFVRAQPLERLGSFNGRGLFNAVSDFLVQGRSRNNCCTFSIVVNLRIDMLTAAED